MAADKRQQAGAIRSGGFGLPVRGPFCVLAALLPVTAGAQTATGAATLPALLATYGWLALLALLPLAFLIGRRSRRARRESRFPPRELQFSKKPELIDELDTENMELTGQVRALTAKLNESQRQARETGETLEARARILAKREEAVRRDKESLATRISAFEVDLARMKDDLAEQEARNETLQARLAERPGGVRPWPPGHEELDGKLSPENAGRDDETTVARLNRKLALARNTIAEFLETQHEHDEADARVAGAGGGREAKDLDEAQLRIELTRSRKLLNRLRSEMQMQSDVIHALESDAVELKRVERLLEDKSAAESFLQHELAEAIEEVARLKVVLRDRGNVAPADDDAADDARLLRAITRSSD